MSPTQSAAPALTLTSPRVWLVPVISVAGLTLLLLTDGNRAAFLAFNRLASLLPDALWSSLTVLGDTLVALSLLLPLIRRRAELVYPVLFAALLATLFVHGLKPVFAAVRPPGVLAQIDFHLIGSGYRAGSFPSGHTTTAFTVAAVLAASFSSRRLAIALICGAGLVGLSRIATGVHWPLDVLAGAGGGWLCGLAGVWLARRWRLVPGKKTHLGFILFFFACAIYLLFFYDSRYPMAEGFERAIAVLAIGLALFSPKAPCSKYHR